MVGGGWPQRVGDPPRGTIPIFIVFFTQNVLASTPRLFSSTVINVFFVSGGFRVYAHSNKGQLQ